PSSDRVGPHERTRAATNMAFTEFPSQLLVEYQFFGQPNVAAICALMSTRHSYLVDTYFAANSSRTPPSRPRASARSVAPASRPGLCQPRIPKDRKERSASAVRKRLGPALAIV